MTLPEDGPHRGDSAPSAKGEIYALSEPATPIERPAVVMPTTRRVLPELEPAATPEPPRLPLLSGIFDFPWRLETLPRWFFISVGFGVSGLGIVYCIWLVDVGLALAARCLAMPALWITAFAAGYASVLCLAIIEQTSQGFDRIGDWPKVEWRESFCLLPTTLGMMVVAAAVGSVVGQLAFSDSWLMVPAAVFLLYPIFLLSAIEGGSPLSVLSGPILRSLKSVWWAWGLFYIETGLLIAVWLVPVVANFPWHPFVATAVAAPLLAATVLIYARLLGRVVWCFAEYGDEV